MSYQIQFFVWDRRIDAIVKWQRTTPIFPGFQRMQRIIWSPRRTISVRVEYFPRPTTVEILREIQTIITVRKTRPEETTTVEILREIQTIITVRKTRPEEFEDRIIFMSMFNDIDWTKNGNYNAIRILKL